MFCSCAQVVSPTGGEKDTQPPKFVRSTPSLGQTDVEPSNIRLYFDEFIDLQNLRKNVLLSPPVKGYEIIRRKRSVEVLLPHDSLKPNTTHIIQFGNAIQDITEGNAAKGFSYVFSTGPQIDSLSLRGRVVEAFTLDSVEGASVMLYKDSSKTAIRNKRPYYYTEANEKGMFAFNYLKEGKYRVYALKDLNNNLKYDGGEKAAFLGKALKLNSDTTIAPLRMFQQPVDYPKVIKAKNPYRGIIQLSFNQKVDTFTIHNNNLGQTYWHLEEGGKKGVIYYQGDGLDSLQSVIKIDKKITDTISISLTEKLKNEKSIDTNFDFHLVTKTVNQNAPIVFRSNHPLKQLDSKGIKILRDSSFIPIKKASIKGLNQKLIEINAPLQEDSSYNVLVKANKVEDIYGNMNDSLKGTVSCRPSNELGMLEVNLKAREKPKGNFILNLLDEDKKVVRDTTLVYNEAKIQFQNLVPGNYQLKAIIDRNRNGFWDEGQLFKNQLPEPVVFYPKELKVKENLELRNITFDLSEELND